MPTRVGNCNESLQTVIARVRGFTKTVFMAIVFARPYPRTYKEKKNICRSFRLVTE